MRDTARRGTARRAHPVAGPVGAALVGAALLISVAAVALHSSDQAIAHDALTRVASNRDAAIRAVDRQATDLKRTISVFAADPAIAARLAHPSARTLSAAEARMGLLSRSKGAAGVVLSDLRGRTAGVYPFKAGLLGSDFSFRDWFKGAKRTGKPYVSAAYRSIAPGAPLAVGASTPVFDKGRRVGYLTIVGKLDAVRAVADQALHDDSVIITVTDQTGQRLTSTIPVDPRGQPITPSVNSATRQALQGHSAKLISDADLAASGPVPGVGWTVTAAQPRAEALAPARSFRRNLELTVGLALLLLLIATAFGIRAARRRANDHGMVEEERLRLTTLFAESPIGILECDADGIVVTVNEALSRMLGYGVDELVGTRGTDLLERDKVPEADRDIASVLTGARDRYTRERLYRARNGRLVPALTSVIVVRHEQEEVRRVVAFIVDQREQKRIESALRASEDRLTELALHDDLTGLANRRMLLDRCATVFATARTGRTGSSIAALFIDLDGFKPVNDHQGHERGDQVLVDVAAALTSVVRPSDTVARVGGDEFVILLEQYDGPAHLHDLADRVIRAVRREVSDGRTTLSVTASVGVASIDLALEPHAEPDQLLSRADTAMYRAKELGRDRHDVYAPDLRFTQALTELPPQRAVLY